MNKNHFLSYCIFLTLTLCFNTQAQDKYNIQDLEVLSQNSQLKEFFDHALDVRPSLRDENWNKLVNQNAQKYLTQLNEAPASKFIISTILTLNQFSFLQSNESYIKIKHETLLKYFKYCINKEKIESCINQAKATVSSAAKDHEYYYNLFKIFTNVNSTSESAKDTLWSLALPLTQDKFSEFYCKKPEFSSYIIAKIVISENIQIHNDCTKELIPAIKAKLGSLTNPKKIINFLLKSNILISSDKDYFSLMLTLTNEDVNLLDAPKALENLERLRSSSKLRQIIIKEIQKEHFIPDQVFGQSSPKEIVRTDALKRKIARSFPEFLSYYSKTCLDYLKGTKAFPLGSPTVNCHNFFKDAKRLSLIDKFTISAYQDITKL